MKRLFLLLPVLFFLVLFSPNLPPANAHQPDPSVQAHAGDLTAMFSHHQVTTTEGSGQNLPALAALTCLNGFAGAYPCHNVDLLAFVPTNTLCAGVSGADIWGWTDPADGREYAVMSHGSSTSFVDISDPVNPVLLGCLPAPSPNFLWRDVEVYGNHAFIVGDAPPSNSVAPHGVQIFDLTQLRSVPRPPAAPVTFQETARYPGGRIHSLTINPSTGFAYLAASERCGRTLEIINIKNPAAPQFAGCLVMQHPDTGAQLLTHEAHCVTYKGPDKKFTNKEICFFANESALTVVDVTNKTFDPNTRRLTKAVVLSNTDYPGRQYTHQGWLTSDQRYFLLGDEEDELLNAPQNTRTYLWNVSNLRGIALINGYEHATTCIDHQIYVKASLAYESNYACGLRILDTSRVSAGQLTEVGFFDTSPSDNGPVFKGAWGNYPFFKSGVVIVADIEQGLFILKPRVAP